MVLLALGRRDSTEPVEETEALRKRWAAILTQHWSFLVWGVGLEIVSRALRKFTKCSATEPNPSEV